MKYRTLGKTGLKVSSVGFGTWQLANDPNSWTGSTTEESLKCLEYYVEQGGNFIDTAWIYGYSDKEPDRHRSEELIGKFLRKTGTRDKIIIASKVPPKNMKWPAWQKIPISEVFPPEWIEKCVDDSLQSLGVKTIDVMQFHVWQDHFTEDDGWKKMVEKTVKEGKVRFWGISVNDYQPVNCIKALDTGLISTIQTIFNVFHQAPIKTLFEYARKNNIGIIARVPLDEGGLSGRFAVDTKFDQGDFRGAYFAGDRMKQLVEHTDRLKALAAKYGIASLPELALRFILSHEQVSTVIPGMRRISHAEANVAVSQMDPLPAKLIEGLRGEAWERNFYPDVDPSLEAVGYLGEI